MKSTLIAAGALGLALTAGAQVNYNNLPSTYTTIYFGSPDSSIYGQVFDAPAQPVLDNWTFYLSNQGGQPLNFDFFLQAWNGSMATGPILFQSAQQTLQTSQTSMTAFTVNPNVALTPGSAYVMYMGQLNNTDTAIAAQAGAGFSPLGGLFEYQNDGGNLSEATTSQWNSWSTPDTAYSANFSNSAVPDAGSSLSLMGMGLAGIAGLRRRFAKA